MMGSSFYMQIRPFLPLFRLILQDYTIGLAGQRRHFSPIGAKGFKPKLIIFVAVCGV